MLQEKVIRESMLATPSALLELFTLNGLAIGLNTVYYFVDAISTQGQNVVFNGVTYTAFPIKWESMNQTSSGELTRPKLTVSNIRGFISSLLLSNQNGIDGATVTRVRVNARFLDASNFPTPTPSWVTPDPTAAYPAEPFVINRKIAENPQVVVWELGTPLETQGVKLPKRQIVANLCAAWKYRDTNCGYTGAPVADVANRLFTGPYYNMTLVDRGAFDAGTVYARGDYVYTTSALPQLAGISYYWVCTTNGTVGITPSTTVSNWTSDSCSKTCAACKLRFGTAPLRIAAFPGVSRSTWV